MVLWLLLAFAVVHGLLACKAIFVCYSWVVMFLVGMLSWGALVCCLLVGLLLGFWF